MIVFGTPKGWTGPKFVDGKPVEGTWRSHQVPISDFSKPGHLELLEDWMQSYRHGELFDDDRRARIMPRSRQPDDGGWDRTRMPMAGRC